MKKARVENGVVVEVLDTLPEMHPDAMAMYQDCPDHIQGHWLFDGTNWTDPATLPAPVPQKASKLRVMRYLKAQGQWGPIRAAIAADEDIKEEWTVSSYLRRDDPTVLAMQGLMGWSDSQVDALFKATN